MDSKELVIDTFKALLEAAEKDADNESPFQIESFKPPSALQDVELTSPLFTEEELAKRIEALDHAIEHENLVNQGAERLVGLLKIARSAVGLFM
jgi:hypothetical protein